MVMAAGNVHRLHEMEIVKIFVSGLKPEIFREEIYFRAFETLVDVMAETRHELVNYRYIMEISERIKRNRGKTQQIGVQMFLYPGNKGASSGKTMDLKDIECFKCHK